MPAGGDGSGLRTERRRMAVVSAPTAKPPRCPATSTMGSNRGKALLMAMIKIHQRLDWRKNPRGRSAQYRRLTTARPPNNPRMHPDAPADPQASVKNVEA